MSIVPKQRQVLEIALKVSTANHSGGDCLNKRRPPQSSNVRVVYQNKLLVVLYRSFFNVTVMVLLLRTAVLFQLLVCIVNVRVSDAQSSAAPANSTKLSFIKWKALFKMHGKTKRVTKKPEVKQDTRTVNPEAFMTAVSVSFCNLHHVFIMYSYEK